MSSSCTAAPRIGPLIVTARFSWNRLRLGEFSVQNSSAGTAVLCLDPARRSSGSARLFLQCKQNGNHEGAAEGGGGELSPDWPVRVGSVHVLIRLQVLLLLWIPATNSFLRAENEPRDGNAPVNIHLAAGHSGLQLFTSSIPPSLHPSHFPLDVPLPPACQLPPCWLLQLLFILPPKYEAYLPNNRLLSPRRSAPPTTSRFLPPPAARPPPHISSFFQLPSPLADQTSLFPGSSCGGSVGSCWFPLTGKQTVTGRKLENPERNPQTGIHPDPNRTTSIYKNHFLMTLFWS